MIYGYDIERKPKNGRSRAVHRTNLGQFGLRPSEEFPGLIRMWSYNNWSYNEVLLYFEVFSVFSYLTSSDMSKGTKAKTPQIFLKIQNQPPDTFLLKDSSYQYMYTRIYVFSHFHHCQTFSNTRQI